MTFQFITSEHDIETFATQKLFWDEELHTKVRTRAYEMMEERHDPSFRAYIKDHCKFVGAQTERMLVKLGWDADVAKARGEDAELHDIGKMYKNQVALWVFTESKPDKSSRPDFTKDLQAEHTFRGPQVLKEIFDDLGLLPADATSSDHTRLDIIRYLQVNHHKPSSPDRRPVLLDVVRTVDTVAGQLKTTNGNVLDAIGKLRGNPEKFLQQYRPEYLDLLESLYKQAPAPAQTLANGPNS